METILDKANNKLIYDRKLKEGSGEAIYGLEVAKAMDLDITFIETAERIRKEILGLNDTIVSKKKSQYNSKILIDNCEICGKKATEIHHIKEQKEADTNNMIGHYHKNRESNLVQLCEECHHEVHHGNLVIKGYIQTSDGRKLDYSRIVVKEIKKKKYSEEDVNNVLLFYNKCNKNYSLTKTKLETDLDLTISIPTIKKMVNHSY